MSNLGPAKQDVGGKSACTLSKVFPAAERRSCEKHKELFFMAYFIRLSSVTIETVKVMKDLWQDGWGRCITTNELL